MQLHSLIQEPEGLYKGYEVCRFTVCNNVDGEWRHIVTQHNNSGSDYEQLVGMSEIYIDNETPPRAEHQNVWAHFQWATWTDCKLTADSAQFGRNEFNYQ